MVIEGTGRSNGQSGIQEGEAIRAQIVVPVAFSIRDLKDLQDKSVAFANPYAFAGYFVPMNKLLRDEITVTPVFAGNQEAAIGQLGAGRVAAAGVNSKVMADYAKREKFAYRVLWTSEPYFDLAVMAHPTVPKAIAAGVRDALLSMKHDPAGYAVLLISARALGIKDVRGFSPVTNADYDNYRAFFRNTRVPLTD